MSERIYQCPVLPMQSCDWVGSAEELTLHFEVIHPKFRINKTKSYNYNKVWISRPLDVTKRAEQHLLLIYSKDVFLLQLKVDSSLKKLWVGVRYVGNAQDAQKFQFCMVLSNEPGLDKIQKKGSMQLDRDWSFDIESMVEFDLNSNFNISSALHYHFQINDSKMHNSLFIDKLKCSVCHNIVGPPVFGCHMGHLCCSRCRREDNGCRSTKPGLCSLTLQDLSRVVMYPCKNKMFGCTMKQTTVKIKTHERNCYALTSCFAEEGCDFVGVAYNWWYHLEEKHPQVTNVYDQERYYDLNKSYFEHMFLRRFGAIFRILCERKDPEGPFVWSCQQVGLKPGEEQQFKLVVKAVDPHNSDLALVGSVPCCSLEQPEDEASEHCAVGVDALQPFIINDKVDIRYGVSTMNN